VVKGQGNWELKCKNRFSRMYLREKIARFTSNQDKK